LLTSAHQVLARFVQRVPRRVVLIVADPDRIVMADPAPGEEVRQGVGRRAVFEIFADLDRAYVLVPRAHLIEGTQKRHAAFGIMFPAILAVKNDAYEHRLIAGDGRADVVQVLHEIVGRIGAWAALVMKADHVTEGV